MTMQDPFLGTYGSNPYAVGRTVYSNNSYSATRGPVDQQGYQERTQRNAQKRNAYLAWLKARQGGQYGSSNAQRLTGGLS